MADTEAVEMYSAQDIHADVLGDEPVLRVMLDNARRALDTAAQREHRSVNPDTIRAQLLVWCEPSAAALTHLSAANVEVVTPHPQFAQPSNYARLLMRARCA